MSKMQFSFAGYSARKSTGGMLPIGRHGVTVEEMREIDDRREWDTGKEKPDDKLPPWLTPTPQLLVIFKASGGRFIHRFNGMGWLRYADIESYNKKCKDGTYAKLATELGFDEMEGRTEGWEPVVKKDFTAMGDDSYAVNKETKERVEDPELTEKSLRFIDQMVSDAGLEPGSNVFETKGQTIGIELREKVYNGNTTVVLKRTYKSAEVTTSALPDADELSGDQ